MTTFGSPRPSALLVGNNLSEIAAAGAAAQLAARTNIGVTAGGIPTTLQLDYLGLGVAPTLGRLHLVSGTTDADGLFFGSDVSLYRSGAGTLKVGAATAATSPTSGALIVGGGVGVASSVYSGVGFFGQRTSGDLDLDLRASTSGASRITVMGYGSQTSLISTANRSSYVDLHNKDTAPNTFTSIGGHDASGNVTSRIAFVNVDDATNEGKMVLLTRVAGGDLAVALTLSSAQEATFTSTISTANPGGGAGAWKLGKVRAGAVALDAANYVEVMIDGAVVKLLKAA